MGIFGHKRTDPITGEQHRSGLRKAFHGLHGLERAARPVVKTGLPIVGSMVGSLFGGPLGALVGGSVGGALSSKSHRLDHALGGAAVGLGNAFVGPHIGKFFGLNPEGTMGGMLGMQHGSMGQQLESLLGPAGFMGRTKPLPKHTTEELNQIQNEMHPPNGKSWFGDLASSDMLNAALFGTAIAGKAFGRTKIHKEPSIQEIMAANKRKWRPEDMPRPVKPMQRRYVQPPPEYQPGIDPEHVYYEDVNPPVQYYARGGYVQGHSGGQSDKVRTKLPLDSFVMDAPTVSLLGDGNSNNGGRKFAEFEAKLDKKKDKFSNSSITKDYISKNIRTLGEGEPYIEAAVSDGEYIFKPSSTRKLGNGSVKKGSQIFNNMRKNIRKEKGVKKFLPPKSKELTHYMR
jgi:hypothetical protein